MEWTGVNPKRADRAQAMSSNTAEWDLREVTYFVKDFHRALAFYESVLGMRVGLKQDGYAQFDLNGLALAIHIAEGDRERAGKENHIAFRVESSQAVDSIYQKLKERGIKFEPYNEGGAYDESVSAEPRNFEWGYRCVFFRDPDGNLIEIFAEYP